MMDQNLQADQETNAAHHRTDEANATIQLQRAFIGRLTDRRVFLTDLEQVQAGACLVAMFVLLLGAFVFALLAYR